MTATEQATFEGVSKPLAGIRKIAQPKLGDVQQV